MMHPVPHPARANTPFSAEAAPLTRGGAPWMGPTLSAAAGVSITSVDLRTPLSTELWHLIRKAFLDHHVVVFPNHRQFRRNRASPRAHRTEQAV